MDKELEAIVQRMIDAGESESNIALVIREYKPLKKEPTEDISQESQLGSQSQIQEGQNFLDTENQKMESESDSSIGEQSNVVELSDSEAGLIPVDSKIKEGSVNLTEAKAWVDFNTTLSVEEEEDVDKEFEEEYNNEGFFNTMTSVLKEAWNQKVGRDSFLSIDSNPLSDEIKEANDALVEEKKEVNSVSLREKTKEIYTKKKKDNLVQSKTNEALGKLPVEIKDKLGVKNREDYKSVSADRVDLVNGIKIKELEFSKAKEVVDSLEGNISSQDDVDEYNRNVLIMRDSKKSVLSMSDNLAKSEENITDLDEEFDNLKRSYSSWDNFSGKFLTSSVRTFGQGGLGFIEWTNDVRKSIMGDDGLSYMPSGILPVPTPLMEAKNKEIGLWLEEKEAGLRKSVEEMNSVGDLIDTTVDVVAVQGANMLPFLLGGGVGIATTGVTALGGKTSEMKSSDKYFTENQLIFAPLLSGGATSVLGAVPTLRMFNRSKGLFKEILKSKGGDVLLKEAKIKVAKKMIKTHGKNLIEEIPTEMIDTWVQNVVDIDLLDNPNNISYDEGMDMTVRDTALFTTVMSLLPLAGGVIKKVLPKSHSEKLNKNAFDIVKLRNQLNLTEDPVLIKDIEGRIESKLNENKVLFEKAKNNIDSVPSELMDKVLSNDKEMISLRGVAESIKKSNLSNEDKAERLSELKVQFDNLSEFNDKALDGELSAIDSLNSKDLIKLKDKAEKELSREKLALGEENFTIEDSEITERALQIYNEKKEVNKLKEEIKNEEKSERTEVAVNESESETGDVQGIESEQENESTNTQEERDGGSIESIKDMDLTNEESKSKVVSFLEDAEAVLNDIDENLKKQGNENLNMGLPIVATRVAVKAMKVAVVSAKTGVEVIEAGIKAVEESAWYKNLNESKKKEFDDNAFEIVSNNITKEVGRQVKNKKESEFSNNVEKKRKVAKRNIKKGKIGNIRGDFSVYSDFVSIPLSAVPQHVRKKFSSVIEMLGKRDKVINIDDDVKTRKEIQEVIDAVDEENNIVSSLRLQYDKFVEENPAVTKFKDIVKALKKEDLISDEEAELMIKRKKSFTSNKSSKTDNTQEIADTKSEIKSKIGQVKTSKNNTKREIENIRKIKDLSNEDIDGLSDSEVKHLNVAIDQIISRGKMSPVVQEILMSVEANSRRKVLVGEIPNFKEKVRHFKTKAKVFVKNNFFNSKLNTTHQKQRITQGDLHEIDMQLGNKKNRNVFKSVFGNLAVKFSAYESKISNVASILEGSLNSLGSSNEGVVSGMKITMYMIAKYKQSNPDIASIFSVEEYVNETVNMSSVKYVNNKTKKLISKVFNEFVSKDSEGNESVEDMYSKLSSKEKKAVDTIRKELDKQIEDAYDTNLFDNNNASLFYKDYFPLNSISTDFEGDLKSKMNSFSNFSSASKNLKELTATTAHGISFNPFDTAFQSIKSTSFQNSFMHESRVANKMFKDIENDNSLSVEDRGVVLSIKEVFDNQIESLVGKGFGDDQSAQFVSSLSSAIKRNAYRVMLGGVSRATTEFLSNLITSVVSYGEYMPSGMSHLLKITGNGNFSRSKDLRDILIALGCTQVDRFTNPSLNNVGRVDFDVSKSIKKLGKSNLDTGVVDVAKKVYKKSGVGKYSDAVATIHDSLISFPDTTTSLPVWLGKFSSEFKKKTGQEIDFDKVKNNDLEYFDSFHKQIKEASSEANKAVKRVASSKNKFEGAVATDSKGFYGIYREYNNFFRSFMKNEFASVKIALHDMVSDGEMTKSEATRLFTGIIVRQVSYGIGVKTISGLVYGGIASMMGYDLDDEEEDDGRKFLMSITNDEETVNSLMALMKVKNKNNNSKKKELTNALLNTGSGLIVGSGGNTTSHIVNTGLEYLNYLYGEGYTRGEGEKYDRYENGTFRSFVPVDNMNKMEFLKSGVKAMSGAHSPMVESILDLNGFGLMSNLGVVLLSKDIKGLSNHLKYDTTKGKESGLVYIVDVSFPEFMRDYIYKNKESMSSKEMKEFFIKSGISKEDANEAVKNMDVVGEKLKGTE